MDSFSCLLKAIYFSFSPPRRGSDVDSGKNILELLYFVLCHVAIRKMMGCYNTTTCRTFYLLSDVPQSVFGNG